MRHWDKLYVLFALTCFVQSQEDKFAGNLVADNDHQTTGDSSGGTTASLMGSNFTDIADGIVHAVPDTSSTQESVGERAKKAPRPLGKPESVGFVPLPEEEGKRIEDDAIKQVATDIEKLVVNSIPTLPASIIKPGRMSNGSWYIVLYASWCIHSQAALSEFLLTIQYIVDHNVTGIVVGKIDIIKHSEVAKHFRLKSTPTIFFFKHGVRHTFDQPEVSTTNLVEFMLDILAATISNVNSSGELAALKKNHSVIFLIAHDGEIDHDWHRIFLKQANDKALKAKFAVTTKSDIVEEDDLSTLPAILVLKDNATYRFRESLTSHSLSKWILVEKDVAFPTVNTSTLRKYLQPVSGRRLAFLVVNEDPSQRTASEKRAIEDIRAVAQGRRLHQRFQFGIVEGESVPEIFTRRSFGSLPFFFAFEPYTGYYYLFQPGGKRGVISKDSITNFLHGINSGEEERLGGITYFDQFQHLYQLGYGVVQSMFVHRPFLSMLTGLCMFGVVCFYIVICWQSHANKPSPAEIRTRKAARARKKKEELEKREAEDMRRRIEAKEMAVNKSRDATRLKRRVQNAESDEVQTATDSNCETGDSDAEGTQSGSEEDSQTER